MINRNRLAMSLSFQAGGKIPRKPENNFINICLLISPNTFMQVNIMEFFRMDEDEDWEDEDFEDDEEGDEEEEEEF